MGTAVTTQHGHDDGVIDLARGDPGSDLLPAALVRQAADRATVDLDPDLLQYGHERGDVGFRAALAGWLASEGAGWSAPERLFVTAGASLALHLICSLFTRPGDGVLVADPTYHLALAQFEDHGLRVQGVASDAHGIDPDALEVALRTAPASLLYLVPAFANPTGATLPLERQEAVVAIAARHGLRVVADEVYRLTRFTPTIETAAASGRTPGAAAGGTSGGTPGRTQGAAPVEADVPRSLAAVGGERVLSLNSVSKILSPGLRLGWIEGPAADLQRIATSGVLRSGGGMNPFTAALVREVIANGALANHVAHVRQALGARHAALTAALHGELPEARFGPAAGGYFLWVRIPGLDLTTPAVAEALRRHEVRVALGTAFTPAAHGGTPGSARGGSVGAADRYRDCMRLCFAHATPTALREGACRLAAALRVLERSATSP